MTGPEQPMTEQDWSRLQAALETSASGQRASGSTGSTDPAVASLLHHAYLLLLDGRADRDSLLALARRGAHLCWPTLVALDHGTTAGVHAVLLGWQEAGLAVAGRGAVEGPDGDTVTPGVPPLGQAQVLSAWAPAAGDRNGCTAEALRRLAADGLLTPDTVHLDD